MVVMGLTGMLCIKMKRNNYFFWGFIFLFILISINFSSAVSYGEGAYGEGLYGIGGHVTSGNPTFSLGQSELEEGYTKTLLKNWKIEFEFENKTYVITLKNAKNEIAEITVSDKEGLWNFNLAVNETKKLDLNDDGFYDLEIFLKDIPDSKADLIVKLIHEEIPAEFLEEMEKETKKKEYGQLSWWLIVSLIVSLIIILFITIFIKIRKKGKPKNKQKT
jgi:hypothetical protein